MMRIRYHGCFFVSEPTASIAKWDRLCIMMEVKKMVRDPKGDSPAGVLGGLIDGKEKTD